MRKHIKKAILLKKQFSISLFHISLLALLLLTVGFLLGMIYKNEIDGNYNKASSKSDNQYQSNYLIKPDFTTTHDWKQFRHSKLGFSFLYPPDWIVNEVKVDITGTNTYGHGGPMYDVRGSYSSNSHGFTVAVNAWSDPMNYADWIPLNEGHIRPNSTIYKIGQYYENNKHYLIIKEEYPENPTPLIEYRFYIKDKENLYVFTFQERDITSVIEKKAIIAKVIGSFKSKD